MIVTPFDGTVDMNKGPFGLTYRPLPRASALPSGNSKLTSLLELVEYFSKITERATVISDVNKIIKNDSAYTSLFDVLSNPEIQQFLQVSTGFDGHNNSAIIVGILASKLIQNTYNDGLSEFTLDLNSIKPLDCFGEHLTLEDGRNFDLTVYGRLGIEAFNNSCCNATVEGSGHSFAHQSYGNFSVWKEKTFLLIGNNNLDCRKYITSNADGSSTYYLLPDKPDVQFVMRVDYKQQALIDNEEFYPVATLSHVDGTQQANKFLQSQGVFFRSWKECTLAEMAIHWQPARHYFNRMDQLFGGSS